uniref:Uncharacterized protein n=1 Tax=Aegilops tauschii subsp. strangulata TaxID=200361 RepID=A0A453ECW8_AEGTS
MGAAHPPDVGCKLQQSGLQLVAEAMMPQRHLQLCSRSYYDHCRWRPSTGDPSTWKVAATQRLCTARACGWKLDGVALTAGRHGSVVRQVAIGSSQPPHTLPWLVEDAGKHGMSSPLDLALCREDDGPGLDPPANSRLRVMVGTGWRLTGSGCGGAAGEGARRRSRILPGSSKEDGRRHEARLDPWVPGSARFEGARIRRDGGVEGAPSRRWSLGSTGSVGGGGVTGAAARGGREAARREVAPRGSGAARRCGRGLARRREEESGVAQEGGSPAPRDGGRRSGEGRRRQLRRWAGYAPRRRRWVGRWGVARGGRWWWAASPDKVGQVGARRIGGRCGTSLGGRWLAGVV